MWSWSHERNSLRASEATLVCWSTPYFRSACGWTRAPSQWSPGLSQPPLGGRGSAEWLGGGAGEGAGDAAPAINLCIIAPLGQLILQRRLIAARRRVASTQHARLALRDCILAATASPCTPSSASVRFISSACANEHTHAPHSPHPSAKTAVIFPAPPHVGGQSGDGCCTPCNERDAAVQPSNHSGDGGAVHTAFARQHTG